MLGAIIFTVIGVGDGRRALLTDTVGFVHKLPHQLVAAFRATLEEVAAADLLLVVADASDPSRRHQQQAVAEALQEIGAAAIPRLTVLNKIDLVDRDSPLRLRLDDAIPVSAATGEGVDDLRCALRQRLSAGHVHVEFKVPYAESHLLGLLRAAGRIEQQEAAADGYRVSAVVPRQLAATLRDVLASR
jgi:GTP-binding protein HflX